MKFINSRQLPGWVMSVFHKHNPRCLYHNHMVDSFMCGLCASFDRLAQWKRFSAVALFSYRAFPEEMKQRVFSVNQNIHPGAWCWLMKNSWRVRDLWRCTLTCTFRGNWIICRWGGVTCSRRPGSVVACRTVQRHSVAWGVCFPDVISCGRGTPEELGGLAVSGAMRLLAPSPRIPIFFPSASLFIISHRWLS